MEHVAWLSCVESKKERFPLTAFDKIGFEQRSEYLIKGLFPNAGLTVVWGPPKCGKTFWVLDALMHVAQGSAYRSHRVIRGLVVYCALEGVSGFRNRVEAFRQYRLGKSDQPSFSLMSGSLRLVSDQRAFIHSICDQIGEEKPAAICIDTLNRSLEGSESSDEDMANYIRAADALREAFDCLVVIIHHCGHNGERPRGHSSLIGAVDVQIAVRNTAGTIVAKVELAKDGDCASSRN
jgi:RecA-family ATPase